MEGSAKIAGGIAGVAALLVIGWQASAIVSLQSRVAALESIDVETPVAQTARTSAPAQTIRQLPKRSQRPVELSAQAGAVSEEGRADKVIDAKVDAALERQNRERMERKMASWMERARSDTEKVVDSMVSEGLIADSVADRVVELRVTDLQEIMELKFDTKQGDLSHEEAMEDYEALQADSKGRLVELIGEEAAVEFYERESRGK